MIWLALILASTGYPDGAPWGHAGAPDTGTCSSCHWDGAPETDSPRLSLDGLPAQFEPGARYEISVRLSDAGAANGFQLVASAGYFASVDASTEARDHAVRSTRAAGDWPIVWIADEASEPVRFWLAVNDANDDMSEFGDTIHLREFESLP
ncbi:choice-of-anchor V domain-containing protein [Hyphobacterium sp.]|uniref:choice-of-anchor V domain-containing protein n=1 Tax=Hyphobacterium sp. TaxID=2004662 RepID=UPI00374A8B5B